MVILHWLLNHPHSLSSHGEYSVKWIQHCNLQMKLRTENELGLPYSIILEVLDEFVETNEGASPANPIAAMHQHCP